MATAKANISSTLSITGTTTSPYSSPITYSITGPIGTSSGHTAADILGARYAPDPANPGQTIITFASGSTVYTANATATSLKAGASQAINTVQQSINAQVQATTPVAPLAIPNPVPNPTLKPATTATLNSLITPTPTIKATQPALIPAPKPVAPTVTNPFTKTVPDPNAIVNAVPNPKLSTNTKVPPIVTPVPTIKAGTPALVAAPKTDLLVKTPTITSGTPKLVAAPVVKGETIVNTTPTSIKPVTTTKGAPPAPTPPTPITPPTSSASGITGAKATTAVKPTQQDQTNFEARKDWRVRLALAPDGPTTKYMYRADEPGILGPLQKTDGVVFPYTPTISVNYAASYEPLSPVHSNYKIHQYTNSSVDSVSLTCDFTAQDAAEAQYILAVIHFFRSMTKMFYGQDKMPKNGTPPPLCYLFGLGEYQFSALPLAITGFNYNLPTDVDYIKTIAAAPAGSPQEPIRNSSNSPSRLGPNLGIGGVKNPTNYGATPSSAGVSATYVPTKIQLSITCLPMMSRNMVSNRFSLKEYANGNLLKGTSKPGGGMW